MFPTNTGPGAQWAVQAKWAASALPVVVWAAFLSCVGGGGRHTVCKLTPAPSCRRAPDTPDLSATDPLTPCLLHCARCSAFPRAGPTVDQANTVTCTPATPSSTTDALGMASWSCTTGTTPGPVTISASAPNGQGEQRHFVHLHGSACIGTKCSSGLLGCTMLMLLRCWPSLLPADSVAPS